MMEAEMARRGRPRKQGKRKASGDLSEAKAERMARGCADIRQVAFQQPHRSWLDESRRADHRAESELGRLYLAGVISEPKYWAGARWRSIIHEFHVVMASPISRGSALSGYVASGMEHPMEADHLAAERPETDEERLDRVLRQHGAAMRALRVTLDPSTVCRTMDEVIISDHACGAADIPSLVQGLSALCALWKMPDPEPDQEHQVKVKGVVMERPRWEHREKEVRIVYAGD